MTTKISRRDFLCGSAAIVGAMMLPTSIIASASDEADEPLTLNLYATSSISTFNWLCKSNGGGRKAQSNWVDPLVLVDGNNNYIPGIAESWEISDNADEWTFHLRNTATWVDYEGNYKADVIADDYLWGLEWVLNYWKNSGVNTSDPCSMIEGAEEYYEYTKTLSEEEGLALGLETFREMVNIEEPDEYTLIYHLIKSVVYFDSVLTSNAFWPLSGSMLEEIGVDGFLTATYDTIWYCGPYTITRFVEGNVEVFSKNPTYWDDTAYIYDEITRVIVESDDVALELYKQGEMDRVQLNASMVVSMIGTELEDKIVRDMASGVTWYLIFNYNKNNEDGSVDTDWNKAAANEAFRQCIYWGVDLTNLCAYADPIEPLTQVNATICPYGLVKFSDGSDYTDRVLELNGLERDVTSYPHMDADKLASYKAQAMEELGNEGVTFPINIDLWCSSLQTYQDQFIILKQALEDGLGTDFVSVTVHTYVTSADDEYIYPGYYSIAYDGIGTSYMDPSAVLSAMCLDNEEGDLVNMYGDVNNCDSEEVKELYGEVTDMVNEANTIVDKDSRYEAFAQAETYAIQHAMLIPIKANKGLELYNYNQYTGCSMLNDSLNFRMVGWVYKEGGYTTEEYEQFEREYKGLE